MFMYLSLCTMYTRCQHKRMHVRYMHIKGARTRTFMHHNTHIHMPILQDQDSEIAVLKNQGELDAVWKACVDDVPNEQIMRVGLERVIYAIYIHTYA